MSKRISEKAKQKIMEDIFAEKSLKVFARTPAIHEVQFMIG